MFTIYFSLVGLVREFEVFATTPEMKRLVKDLANFAKGIRNLNLFKFMFNGKFKRW
jgi:sulfur relay (sulfurtransferase) DsrC/TusE family protein